MTHHTFTRLAAAGLLIGPVLFTLGDLVRRLVASTAGSSPVELSRAVGTHPAAWLAAGLLSLLAAPLLVIGVTGLVLQAHGRGGRTTLVGACLVAVGGFAAVGHAVAFYAPAAGYDRAATPPAMVQALDHAAESYPLLVAVIALFIVGMMLGSVVLLVGLRRARRVPLWSPAAGVVFVVAGGSGGVAAGVVGVLASLAAFGPAAWSLVGSRVPAPTGAEQGGASLPA